MHLATKKSLWGLVSIFSLNCAFAIILYLNTPTHQHNQGDKVVTEKRSAIDHLTLSEALDLYAYWQWRVGNEMMDCSEKVGLGATDTDHLRTNIQRDEMPEDALNFRERQEAFNKLLGG